MASIEAPPRSRASVASTLLVPAVDEPIRSIGSAVIYRLPALPNAQHSEEQRAGGGIQATYTTTSSDGWPTHKPIRCIGGAVTYLLRTIPNAPYGSEVCVCFLPIHSGHQVRWTYQPGSHRRKVTQDF